MSILTEFTFEKKFLQINGKKKQGSPPTTEITILRHLARNGNKTRSEIGDEFDKKRQEIKDAVQKLDEKKLVVTWCPDCNKPLENYSEWDKHVETVQHISNKNNFKKGIPQIAITKGGFYVALDDNYLDKYMYSELKTLFWKPITSEQFWKNLSNSNYSDSEINIIAELFEERVLKIDQSHVIPQLFLEKINDKDLHDYGSNATKNPLEDRVETIPPILKIISKNEPMTPSQIIQKLKNIDITDIGILIDEGLIRENYDRPDLTQLDTDELFVKSHARYDLTHLGLLELFFLIFKDANLDLYYNRHPNLIKRNDSDPKPISFEDWDKSKDPHAKKIVKELDILRLKYVDLLPDIFKENNFKKLGITFSKVVALLLRLYKNLDYLPKIETKIMSNIQFNTLQRLDNIRQDFYHNKIREHLDISDETRHMIQWNKNTRSLYWQYINLDETEEPELNQTLNDRIRNKINFDFYSICKAYCSDSNTRPSKTIREWHDQEIRTLLDFSKNYIKNIELSL